MTKLVVAFRSFSDCPKIDDFSYKLVLFTPSGGEECEEFLTIETARRTQDPKMFLDIVHA